MFKLVLGYSEITLLSNYVVFFFYFVAVLGYSEITLLSNARKLRADKVLSFRLL